MNRFKKENQFDTVPVRAENQFVINPIHSYRAFENPTIVNSPINATINELNADNSFKLKSKLVVTSPEGPIQVKKAKQ